MKTPINQLIMAGSSEVIEPIAIIPLNEIPTNLNQLVAKWAPFFERLPAPYVPVAQNTYRVIWNSRMRSRAGVCKAHLSEIELNPHLLSNAKDAEETLVHEICHLAVFRRWPHAQSHGVKWRKLMILCGFEPERCHKIPGVRRHNQRRWSTYCGCREHVLASVTYNRLLRGIRYKCRSCGGPIRPNPEQRRRL